jgi:5-(carboxyamino)imidazole ribonucleotide mutase
MAKTPVVAIVMGSDSDLEIMREAGKALEEFGIAYEMDVTSAHRSPARTSEFARNAAGRGIRVIIAGAGGAAHLAGVIAAPACGTAVGPTPLWSQHVFRSLWTMTGTHVFVGPAAWGLERFRPAGVLRSSRQGKIRWNMPYWEGPV